MVKYISLVLLIAGFALCSAKEANSTYARGASDTDTFNLIKKYQEEDRQNISAMKRDIVLYRQGIMKAINDLDLIALRAQNSLNSTFETNAAAEADSNRDKALENYREKLVNLKKLINSYVADSLVASRNYINTISFYETKSQLDDELRQVTNFVNGLQVSATDKKPEVIIAKDTKTERHISEKAENTKSPEKSDTETINQYNSAKIMYDNGDYGSAIAQFEVFMQQHSKDELAPNAQYWLGESYYSNEDYNSAIKEFDRVIWRYPDSGKAADAQFKIGLSYLKLGNKQSARQELEKTKRLYPNYERMAQVDKYLSGLK